MNGSGLAGRVAVVTGAAGGIGAAICATLAGCGAVIAAVDTNQPGLVERAAALSGAGSQVATYPVDVTDAGAVAEMVEAVERLQGPVSILVNAAGILRTGPILDMAAGDWAAVFAVNTAGVFHVSQAVGRQMARRRGGSIVTVASNAGAMPRMNMAAYGASKAASALFTKCLGLEFAQFGIRCNVVSPGSTDTAMLRSMWADEGDASATIEGSLTAFRVGIPLGNVAQPADIASAVLFLVSDEAKHVTMHDLCVDGGAALGC